MAWGSPEEVERRSRIRTTLWAYAYEMDSSPLATDQQFDEECLKVNLDQPTGYPLLDQWFRENFTPYTGQWIHKHPDLPAVKRAVQRLRKLGK